MREIKFRYTCKRDNGHVFSRIFTLEQIESSEVRQWWELNHVGNYKLYKDQYTGLKDKQGKEIYEGDILRVTRFNWKELGHPAHRTNLTNICYVFWDEERLAFRADGKFKGGGGFGWGFPIADDRADKTEIEVIGNIYENPALLEVTE